MSENRFTYLNIVHQDQFEHQLDEIWKGYCWQREWANNRLASRAEQLPKIRRQIRSLVKTLGKFSLSESSAADRDDETQELTENTRRIISDVHRKMLFKEQVDAIYKSAATSQTPEPIHSDFDEKFEEVVDIIRRVDDGLPTYLSDKRPNALDYERGFLLQRLADIFTPLTGGRKISDATDGLFVRFVADVLDMNNERWGAEDDQRDTVRDAIRAWHQTPQGQRAFGDKLEGLDEY